MPLVLTDGWSREQDTGHRTQEDRKQEEGNKIQIAVLHTTMIPEESHNTRKTGENPNKAMIPEESHNTRKEDIGSRIPGECFKKTFYPHSKLVYG
ncbi:MAG: hypothetical protein HUU43_05655 [Ignavibacteriaceae bacterium]|nr:hypothetical protein [Ignavibacteriaceae bacterium]